MKIKAQRNPIEVHKRPNLVNGTAKFRLRNDRQGSINKKIKLVKNGEMIRKLKKQCFNIKKISRLKITKRVNLKSKS